MNDKSQQNASEYEIDLIELVREIWSQKLLVIKVTSAFFLVGAFVAFTKKNEYATTSKLMPESQENRAPDLGGLGGLAGLAGIDLGLNSQGVLTPALYPEIVGSVPFVFKLVNTPIYFESLDTTVSSFEYFSKIQRPSFGSIVKNYTIGLPGKIKKWISNSGSGELPAYDMIRISEDDWEIIEEYSQRLSVSVAPKTGIISIRTEMPDAVASAKLASLLIEELTKNVTNYKIEKARVNLAFVEERFVEAQEEYERRQEQLAIFTDRNKNISNSLVQTEYERLQNEMTISFEVYKGLATQLEQAKIKVKEETPVFTVLEPIRIPERKSRPKRLVMLITFALAGGVLSAIYVLVKFYFRKV